jgi:hypothetical protein
VQIRYDIRKLGVIFRLIKFRLENRNKEKFECPICGYKGPFKDVTPLTGFRKHAQCSKCSAFERHRLQYLVTKKVCKDIQTHHLKMLHFFSRIEEFASDSMPPKYQLFIYEDRSRWPTNECSRRPPMTGEKHVDIVPVCYA